MHLRGKRGIMNGCDEQAVEDHLLMIKTPVV